METVSTCNLCGTSDFEPYLSLPGRTRRIETFFLEKCSHCGLVFVNPRPTSSEIGPYYGMEYVPHRHSGRFELYSFVRVWTNRWKKRQIESMIEAGTLLDYGCGTGEFLSVMKRSGWDVHGFEVNPGAAAYAREHLKLNVSGSLLEASGFDVITFWHSLEHLHDPQGVLASVSVRLKPGGRLLIALPNFRSADRRFYGSDWAAWDAPRHLFHFDPETMKEFLRRNGFQVIRQLPLPVDFLYHVLLSETEVLRRRGPKIRKILSPFYFCLAILLSGWGQWKGNGSSILYIAERE